VPQLTEDLSILVINGHPRATLNRQLSSLRSQGFRGEIVVADGVAEPFPEKMRAHLGGKVVHLPMEESVPLDRTRNFFARVHEGVACCSGNVVALCPSDDLLIVEAVISARKFLDDYPEYVSCQMHALRSAVSGVTEYRQIPVNMVSPEKRVAFHALGGSSFFWAVHRKEQLKTAMDCIRRVDGGFQVFSEHLFYFLMLQQGKIGRVAPLGLVKDQFDESRPQTETQGFHSAFSRMHWEKILSGVKKVEDVFNDLDANVKINIEKEDFINLLFEYLIGMSIFRINEFRSIKIPDKHNRFEAVQRNFGQRDHKDLMSEHDRVVSLLKSQYKDLGLEE
tara:strand:+ start:4598 stop:5605 length:1008 start_codon:yes stop_codon:yes gene_type:complete